jgi:aryl-alcohol dehydrogenase-like predicted oxidoreductase
MNTSLPAADVPLILGGHSFVTALGNDPLGGVDDQVAIVNECLDRGIRMIDTTYQPERIALGRILSETGRRKEVEIIAWNFFIGDGPDSVSGGADYYRPEHIGIMLNQLRTDKIDYLVVHGLEDDGENRRQLELALEWKRQGLVSQVGTWHPDGTVANPPYDFMVRPWNIDHRGSAEVFESCKRNGLRVFGCSPFVRGWRLDELVLRATGLKGWTAETVRGTVADLMLRFSVFQPFIDRLIVAIRRREWVGKNIESLARGPLTAGDLALLQKLSESPC